MRPPETIYRGERLTDGAGRILGVRVTVNGREFSPDRSRRVWDHSPTGFEWGYGGSGPSQLALALVLDATGEPELARRTYQWFKWATVACWGQSWQITAGEIHQWLAQCQRETRDEEDASDAADEVQVVGGGGPAEYDGPLQCPRCQRQADSCEWPTHRPDGYRYCPTCSKGRGNRVVPLPVAVAKDGAA